MIELSFSLKLLEGNLKAILEAWTLVEWLRGARWRLTYAVVAHVFCQNLAQNPNQFSPKRPSCLQICCQGSREKRFRKVRPFQFPRSYHGDSDVMPFLLPSLRLWVFPLSRQVRSFLQTLNVQETWYYERKKRRKKNYSSPSY